MGSNSKKTCVNPCCGTTNTCEWKKGWPLRSGDFALLCFTCGSAYENYVYCETFHAKESGWRECFACNKRLHCGCIASESSIQILDYGGVGCSSCERISKLQLKNEVSNGFGGFSLHRSENMEEDIGNGTNEGKLVQLCKLVEANELNQLEGGESSRKLSQEVALSFSNSTQQEDGGKFPNVEKLRSMLGLSEVHKPVLQASLGMSIVAPSFNSVPTAAVLPSANDKKKEPSKSLKIVPPSTNPDSVKASPPEPRIARPPAEGRGKNQLLPRYWPRITDQELQQLSGDLNSKIVPLFEKVLSASDAGRIGRLVLPKACAEAYFPPISQSEGVPIRMQDIKGREWTFQFRFWPNNNSRMYVLEGVTPCIQAMQLKAGDTITFSRIDPGGRLVLGYRKATNNSNDPQDDHAFVILNPTSSGDNFGSGEADFNWNKNETSGNGKKKARNIGTKNKRLLINSKDAMELRLTWEETQDLLRPPPNVMPSVISIDDHEFEEYDEPPVFGKRTIFTCRSSGKQDQWAQCDDCFKWRILPVEALLPPKWTCSDNQWDPARNSCSAEEEANPNDMENGDVKKRKPKESRRASQESEPSGLDALASAAAMGENGEPSVTTKHPRHRPGCTCIVCIQPPSGKGKHKPACTCNVCMTVKRRFKTLMLRKKKRQSEESQKKISNDVVLDVNNLEAQPTSPREIDLNYYPNLQELVVDGLGVMNAPSSSSAGKSNGQNSKLLSDHEAFLASIGWDRGSK